MDRKKIIVICLLLFFAAAAAIGYKAAADDNEVTTSADPLGGLWESTMMAPKHRLWATFLGSDNAVRSFEGTQVSDDHGYPSDERRTAMSDDFKLTAGKWCYVYSTASCGGIVPQNNVSLDIPFYSSDVIPSVPRQLLANTYFIVESKKHDGEYTTSAWIELTDEKGRLGRMKFSEFTPAYTLCWHDDTNRNMHSPTMESNISHELHACDWNSDGYSDYLISYIRANNNGGGGSGAVLAVVDGKGLYNYVTGASTKRPSVWFLNGNKGSQFETGGKVHGGSYDKKPPQSYRCCLGDFNGDGRQEIAMVFTKIRGSALADSVMNRLEVYYVVADADGSLSGKQIYALDGGACGHWMYQGNSVGIAAGDIENTGRDELFLLYARESVTTGNNVHLSILQCDTSGDFSPVIANKQVADVQEYDNGSYANVSPLNAVVGDFDGDGYKELAWSYVTYKSKNTLGIWVHKWETPDNTPIMDIGTVKSYTVGFGDKGSIGSRKSALISGRFVYPGADGLVRDQLSVALPFNDSQIRYMIYSWDPGAGLQTRTEYYYQGALGSHLTNISLAAADLKHESLVLGTPLVMNVVNHTGVMAIIQAPPHHWDVVSSDARLGAGGVSPDAQGNVPIDVYYGLKGYSTVLATSNGDSNMTSKTTTNEGGSGVEVNFAYGHNNAQGAANEPNFKLSASVSDHYVKTNKNTKSFSREISKTYDAAMDDVIYANLGNCTVWRYPVVYPLSRRTVTVSDDDGNDVKAPLYIQYVVPTYVGEQIMPIQGRSASWYRPYHDNANLFTYPSRPRDILGYPGTLKDWSSDPKDLTGVTLMRQDNVTFLNPDASSATIKLSDSANSDRLEENKLKVTTAIGVQHTIGGGVPGSSYGKISLNFTGDYAWTHATTTTANISKSNAVTVRNPGFSGYTSKSGLPAEKLQFTGGVSIYTQDDGVLCTAYTVNGLRNSGSPLWGSSSPYAAHADPGFNMPYRWNLDGTLNTDQSHGYMRGISLSAKGSKKLGDVVYADRTPGTLLPTNATVTGSVRIYNYSFVNAKGVTLQIYRQKALLPVADGSKFITPPNLASADLIATVPNIDICGRESVTSGDSYRDNWEDAEFTFKTGAEEEAYWLHYVLKYADRQLNQDNDYGYLLIGTQDAGSIFATSSSAASTAAFVSTASMPDMELQNVSVRTYDEDNDTLSGTVNMNKAGDIRGKRFRVTGRSFFTAGHVSGEYMDNIHAMYVMVVADGSPLASDYVPTQVGAYDFSLDFMVPEGKTPKEIKLVVFSNILNPAYEQDTEDNVAVLYKQSDSAGGSGGGCDALGGGAVLLAAAALLAVRKSKNSSDYR